MAQYHDMTAEDALRALDTDKTCGLTNEEAEKRLAAHGPNALREAPKKTFLQRFAAQFKDVMIIILLAAAAISFVIAARSGDMGEFFEPALILAIVILNALTGVIQESRAEKAMDALKSLSAPHARVIRGGLEAVIDAKCLVPGDIIRLEAGDMIPADCRILECASLTSGESALTGESVPSEKSTSPVAADAPLGDRQDMLFSGCSVATGRVVCAVAATGMDTEMGKISSLLSGETDSDTPLQKKLAELGKILGAAALVCCAVIFVIGLIAGTPVMEIFMTAVSLAVSAIPEGLPAIVTVVLSIGLRNMAKRNAVVRRLPAVETLGSASVICSDKTGTLTQNKMTLMHAYVCEDAVSENISDNCSEAVRALLMRAALCCDGSYTVCEGKETAIGDPTETSILAAAHRNGMIPGEIKARYPRLAEIPFDSDRKLMTTVHKIDGRIIQITKGAYDVIAARSIAGDSDDCARQVNAMCEDALRVIAVAVKELDRVPETMESDTAERDLTLIGLVGMIDPPRPEAYEAVRRCRAAGIKPVMITGDHSVTAAAIAREIGIMQPGDRVVNGMQLRAMSDDELKASARDIAVYARVSPEDKIRIVHAWQELGGTVAMTGDGVNDAPALKAADIGCAMGITGTDVAKGAADMTLSDDNFSTIVEAVREGRGIYDNIRKVTGFLLGTNIGEILCVFFAMLIWKRSPLLSSQLLLINLATDSLPAIALGMEAVDDDVMRRPPRPSGESVFAGGAGLRIALQGILFGAITLIAYAAGCAMTGMEEGGRTAAFLTLSVSQIIQAFNARSEKSLVKTGVFTNRMLDLAALASCVLIFAVAFIPAVRRVFGLIALPVGAYAMCAALCLVSVPLHEAVKYWKRRRAGKGK